MTRYLYLDCEAIPPGEQPEDPEALAEWIKLAARPGSARIVCMSYALDAGDVSTVETPQAIAQVLHDHSGARWVAHYGLRYDFPLIYANLVRAKSRGGAVKELASRMVAKPWETSLVDTARVGGAYVKLTEYAEMMGTPTKSDDIGARVYEVWATEPARVRRYCEGDVFALRAAHQESLKTGMHR